MGWNSREPYAQSGDLIQLVGLRHKNFLFRLQSGADFQSHRGVIKHDEIIGKPWGSQIFSHNGSPFFILQPTLADITANIKRNTQILYPKDIGFLAVMMGIGPGMTVVEAGTGSGAMSCAFAYLVGPEGRVISYEKREEMQEMALHNLRQIGMEDRVTMKLRDIAEGLDDEAADAFFLDVPNPWDYIGIVRKAMKPGAAFGCILPTANQVCDLLVALRDNQFAFIEVAETFLRWYKAHPTRFRPTDRMVGHTGFLIFARPVVVDPAGMNPELLKVAGMTIDEVVDDSEHDSDELA
ncbi:MAG: tRNA (adenine-N1)-methyltransferase [Anaerolineae bacterium]|nr:tRNA (adenine-N1)-methyltransferase [Anaerolineae bacterium]